MPQTKCVLTRDVTIDGRVLKKGEVIATIQTPDGVPVARAINAVTAGFAELQPAVTVAAAAKAPNPPALE